MTSILFKSKIFSLFDQHQKVDSIKLFLLMILSAIAELFSLSLLIVILNFFLKEDFFIQYKFIFSFLDNFPFFSEENLLFFFLAIFFVIFLLKFLILIYYSWVESKFMAQFREKLSNNLFKNFLYRDPTQLLKKNSSEYLRNFTSEVEQTTHFYHSIFKIATDSVILVALFTFLLIFNPQISITVAIIFSLLSISYYFTIRNSVLFWGKKNLKSKKKGIQFINESFSAIKYIKMLSKENYFYKKLTQENSILANIKFKMSFVNSLPRNVLEFFLFITILILIMILFKNNYELNEIIKIMSVYIITAFRLIPSGNRILASVQLLRFSFPSFEKMLKEKNTKIIKKDHRPSFFPFNDLIKIEVNNFRYENGKSFKIKKIKLKISKKSRVGIIGSSGSGKSTLVNIVCGLITNKSCRVYSDNENIKHNLEGWQKNIGYIPQNIVILNATLRDNILFGSNRKDYKDREILKIIKKANLINFYKKLSKGLNSVIKEEGLNISGGEIQRIGIARALLHNPEIIIMDESTSALDTFTENQILKEIKFLRKTTIFVSHRLNSLKFCDKIYGIDKGVLKKIDNFNKMLKG